MDKYSDINKEGSDYAHSMVKVALGSIPVVGGAASEIFEGIITPSIEKRREAWLDSLASKLIELTEKVEGLNIEMLTSNEAFITCIIEASQLAIKNHQEEKIEYLRNAIINTALYKIDDDKTKLFINLVGELNCWHIRILNFLNDPNRYYDEKGIQKKSYYMGSIRTVLEDVYPELIEEKEYVNKLIKDLYNNGLINVESISTGMTEQGMYASRTTKFGSEFITFITNNT